MFDPSVCCVGNTIPIVGCAFFRWPAQCLPRMDGCRSLSLAEATTLFFFLPAPPIFCPPCRQLSVKFGVNLDAVNRSILRAINNGTAPCRSAAHTEFEPPRPAPSGNAAPSDANGIATGRGGGDSSSGSASAGRDTAAPADAGGKNAAGTVDEKNQRVFLTSQEGVHVSGDQACGGGDQECVALRYAVGGSVSLADAWPLLVERARGVMQSELGHIHFCNCFS